MNSNKILQKRIEELEKENAYLKSLLEHAGISYAKQASDSDSYSLETVPNNEIMPVEITLEQARLFFSYFWGRMDVYAKRSENKKTGKAGYFPQCENFWRYGVCPKAEGKRVKCMECEYRKWVKLDSKQVEAHLRGDKDNNYDVIGVYPLFPDGTCRFIAFDFDNHESDLGLSEVEEESSWMDEVNSLRTICDKHGIPCLVERSRSGNGAHL